MRRLLKLGFIFFAALMFPAAGYAAEYEADLGLIIDFEELRPLIDGCSDLGELEQHRHALEAASDLENLRSFLEGVGYAEFTGCPSGIEAIGVERTD